LQYEKRKLACRALYEAHKSIPHGNMPRTLTSFNCSGCKTEYLFRTAGNIDRCIPVRESLVAFKIIFLLRCLSPQANYTDRATAALSAKLVPTSADRGCHVVSLTEPYGCILGFLDRTSCVNPIDKTHYSPITTTSSTRTKYSHKILH
jgi:hypothetical protein